MAAVPALRSKRKLDKPLGCLTHNICFRDSVSAKEPYMSTKEPCVSAKEPYMSTTYVSEIPQTTPVQCF